LLNLIYKRLKAMHYTLSVVLTSVDSSRNIKKCTSLLNNLSIALLLLFLAMLSPFAMFAFNLNQWYNLVPFAFILIAFYYIRNLVMLVDGRSSNAASYAASLSAAKF